VVALTDPAKRIVGDKTAVELERAFGIRTVGELLRHYPRRYFERGELADLSELTEGAHVTVQAQVTAVSGRKIRDKLHKTDLRVTDGRHQLAVTFFNRPYIAKQAQVGETVLLAGTVERFNHKLQLTNPELAVGADAEEFAGGLRPIYPATSKLPSWNIAKAVRTVLQVLEVGADPLPSEIRLRRGLIGLSDALRQIHQPTGWPEITTARKRLRFEEAFVLQAALAQRRAAAARVPTAPREPHPGGLLDAFDAQMPFQLTAGQREVEREVLADLASTVPMHRLLQGEVGSGKTLVALRAMLVVADSGGQSALLAPTEVLAQQHARVLSGLLGPLGDAGRLGSAELATRVTLLTGSQSAAQRKQALLDAASGVAGIVVGTHALLQDTVQFADLGLVVVDEQHRFGVEQRDALRAKATQPPHLLVMTATPIPRTVAMTVFGDLETSTLTELPGGRSAISTHVANLAAPKHVARMWELVTEEVGKGHQVYVVCPRIGDGVAEEPTGDEPADEPKRPAAAVTEWLPRLQELLPGVGIGMLHGRLPADEKDAVMRSFADGQLDVLLATTVIEVGVDVPNATLMVILDADRFGVSQLHQLRGRVGRGSAPGSCLLATSADPETPAAARLAAVAATLDGFELARLDLEQRREGNVLGSEQSGSRSRLRMLSLLRDEDVIVEARESAFALIADDEHLDAHPALRAAIGELLAESADYLDKA
jgi:ATP-dependent DNA helicase RecG